MISNPFAALFFAVLTTLVVGVTTSRSSKDTFWEKTENIVILTPLMLLMALQNDTYYLNFVIVAMIYLVIRILINGKNWSFGNICSTFFMGIVMCAVLMVPYEVCSFLNNMSIKKGIFADILRFII